MIPPANDPNYTILVVEDDPATQNLIQIAFEDFAELSGRTLIKMVETGLAAMNYLQRQGVYADKKNSPKPDIIVLDINIPIMDGKSVLKEIRSDEDLTGIPVLMLSTSERKQDVDECYALGANIYLTKPDNLEDFIWMIRSTCYYWLRMAKLPAKKGNFM